MLLFHGTTVENAKNILKHGFSYDSSIWTCSEAETYFYHENYFRKEYEIEDRNEILERGIQEALGQSLITLAIQNPMDYRGAVLVFDSELMNNKDEINPDFSCQGMDHIAVALRNPDMRGLVGVYVMDQDLRATRLFQLAQLVGREWIMEVELPSHEGAIVDALVDSSVFVDVMENVTYTKKNIKKTNNRDLLKVA